MVGVQQLEKITLHQLLIHMRPLVIVPSTCKSRHYTHPYCTPLFAQVYSNFAKKVAYLHFLTLTLCTFDMGKCAKSCEIVQKKA